MTTNHPPKIVVREDSRNPVVIQHSENYGPTGIDVRVHYCPKASGEETDELVPTQKGARIPEEDYNAFLNWALKEVLGWDDISIGNVADLLEYNGAEHLAENWRKFAVSHA